MQETLDRFRSHLDSGALVVDVGAGPGTDSADLRARQLRVVSLDLSLGMLQAGQRELPGLRVQADMLRLPFGMVVDGLWANASLLHLPREAVAAALLGFRRVLRSPGLLYVSVKQGNHDGWEDQRYGPGHPRWFTYWQAEELDAVLSEAGFREIDARTVVGPRDTWLQRLMRPG